MNHSRLWGVLIVTNLLHVIFISTPAKFNHFFADFEPMTRRRSDAVQPDSWILLIIISSGTTSNIGETAESMKSDYSLSVLHILSFQCFTAESIAFNLDTSSVNCFFVTTKLSLKPKGRLSNNMCTLKRVLTVKVSCETTIQLFVESDTWLGDMAPDGTIKPLNGVDATWRTSILYKYNFVTAYDRCNMVNQNTKICLICMKIIIR